MNIHNYSNSDKVFKEKKGRKQKNGTKNENERKFRTWEDNPEEEIPLDDNTVTMAELCKDVKRGRKSKTFKELELKKYQKIQQRRIMKKSKNQNSQNNGNSEPITENTTTNLNNIDSQIDDDNNLTEQQDDQLIDEQS